MIEKSGSYIGAFLFESFGAAGEEEEEEEEEKWRWRWSRRDSLRAISLA